MLPDWFAYPALFFLVLIDSMTIISYVQIARKPRRQIHDLQSDRKAIILAFSIAIILILALGQEQSFAGLLAVSVVAVLLTMTLALITRKGN